MRDEFEAEDFCTAIFDEFFFASIAHDNTVRHLLRLLWFVHTKVSATRLENLMKLTEPSNADAPAAAGADATAGSDDPMVKVYSDLKEKVDAHLAALAKTAREEEELKGSAENLI